MYRIDIASAAGSLPAPASPGTPGYFTDGNPGTGAAPTIVPAEFLNRVQEELMSFLTAASITPSKTTYNQVARAVQSNTLNSALDTSGSANSIAVALPINPATLTQGFPIYVKIANNNTGATNIAINGGSNIPVTYNGSALSGGELKAGITALLTYDVGASSFQLAFSAPSAAIVYRGGVTTGTANAQVVSVTPGGYALTFQNIVTFNASASNTGSMTLNVAGTGAITVKKRNTTGLVNLATGDIISGEDYVVIYDGTFYEIFSQSLPNFGNVVGVNYTVSSSAPSGGNDGDVWYQQ